MHQIVKVSEIFRNEVDSPEAGIRVGGREGHVRVGEVMFRNDVRETRGQERCRTECTVPVAKDGLHDEHGIVVG